MVLMSLAVMFLPAPSAAAPDSGAERVDVVLSAPTKFVGKKIKVVGFLSLRFEDVAIYEATQFYKTSDSSHSIWLEISEVPKGWRKLEGKLVQVEGFATSTNKGHMDMWPMAIEKIISIVPAKKN